MKRTVRLLALAAAPVLLLAACGSSGADEASPSTEAPAAESTSEEATTEAAAAVDEAEDDVDADSAASDAGGAMDITDEAGNLIGTEFGDGEQIMFDTDLLASGGPMAPGTRVYGASENGGDFIVTTKVDPIQELEDYREEAGAEPVGYMTVDADNRDGTENMNMYEIRVYDEAGNEYAYSGVSDYVDEWRDALGSDDVDLYNEGVELSNEYSTMAHPMQRETFVLAGPVLPDEIVGVIVMPRGVFETTTTVPLKD